ncbi:hypothetical protein [Pseudonocardia oroxyli]|uniref:Uncharacterized protein n=1 Tax=Pseudonocardia oroxyli TaxID=366584 RepID=A0A1G7SXL1_PSEOR|nr:hypothetical protein [Pseudonocardia oroxyli]SDG27524.1 hypothetical protein SAMN05216377_110125 [Pseudonocardia oroxyli]
MTSKQRTRNTTTDTTTTRPEGAACGIGERADGTGQVIGFSVRLAGRVPTRLDLQHAGTPEVQLGFSAGPVLVYLGSHYTAARIAQSWAAAAPVATSLVPHLSSRRSVLTAGPWSVSAMVRLGGEATITGGLLPGRRGSELPSILRLQVGPITWELCDGASYTTMLAAWRKAAALLATVDALYGP